MSQNGKGSGRRGVSKEELSAYESGWERIFGKQARQRALRTCLGRIAKTPKTRKPS